MRHTAEVPAITQNKVVASPTTTSSTANAQQANSQDQSTKNIRKVSHVSSGMKPEEAVAILNNLDITTVSAILQKMGEDQAAKILAVMDPKRASAISQELLQYRSTPNQKTN